MNNTTALSTVATPTVICLGPGGVGKTSISAALALALARSGKRVVVLTIDPARRLADAMGLDEGLGNEPQQIDGDWNGELWATMLDPRATFESVVRAHAPSESTAQRILDNRLFTNLTESLSGTGEYMATERLHALRHDDRFDVVVIDTPPSRHAFDFLDSPGRLTRFIDHPLYRTVLAPRRNGLVRAISNVSNLAIRSVSKVVGADLLAEVVDFFSLFDEMDQGFRDRAAAVDEHLASDDTSYVIVSAARHQAIDEAGWIAQNLLERDRRVSLLVVNRVVPPVFAATGIETDADQVPESARRTLRDLARQIEHEQALISDLAEAAGVERPLTIPQLAQPVSDLDGLLELSNYLDGRRTIER